MNLSDISGRLGEDWSRMQELMSETLASDVNLLNDVNAPVLRHPGKLMRPMISLLIANAIGRPNDDTVRLAAASEILHNATLMHDDVADDSQQRRGFPTLRSILGPSSAVLVGDFWLAKAVELVFDCKCRDKVLRLFSKTMTDLAEGEMLQLEKAESADTTEEDYLRIIRCKTSSLFTLASLSSAVSLGAGQELTSAARAYSDALGVAFQIKDDILDYAGTPEMGKPVGVDIRERKITLPLLGALRNSREDGRIRQMVREIDSHPGNLETIRRFVIDGGGIEYASARLDEFIRKAVSALSAFGKGWAVDCLADIAGFNAYRQI